MVKLLSEGIVNAEKLTEAIHGRTVNRVGKEVITAALTGVVTEVDIDPVSYTPLAPFYANSIPTSVSMRRTALS